MKFLGLTLFLTFFTQSGYSEDCTEFRVKRKTVEGEIVYYDKINDAISEAQEFDKIRLGAGQFNETIKINSKNNLIISSHCNPVVESIKVSYSSFVKIRNLTIDGQNVNKDGVRIQGASTEIILKNLIIKNASKNGVFVNPSVDKVYIRATEIENNSGHGVYYKNNKGVHIINNSKIHHNGLNGVLTGDNKLRLKNSEIYENGQNGNKSEGYGLLRESKKDTDPKTVKVKNTSFLNNNGKVNADSTIDIGNISTIADAGDISNTTTGGTEFPVSIVRPVAITAKDIKTTVGSTIVLDGSKSYDPTESSLNYTWSIKSAPNNSTAGISSPNLPITEFTLDQAGDYVFSLKVSNTQGESLEDTILVSTNNIRPTAKISEGKTLSVGELVNISGEGSLDEDDDSLSYVFSFSKRPNGSQASLIVNGEEASFTADVAGDYVVDLIVNDGTNSSKKVSSYYSTENSLPMAKANIDFNHTLGSAVELSSENSTDYDQNPRTYSWTILHAPAESMAIIYNPENETTNFNPDVNGLYIFQVIANDGVGNSIPYVFWMDVKNAAPISVITVASEIIETGVSVNLSGLESSDDNNDPLTYIWRIIEKPVGSTLDITSNDPNVNFIPDVSGQYKIGLIVNDRYENSVETSITLVATHRPVVSLNSDLAVNLYELRTITANGNDADGENLTYRFNIDSAPANSLSPLSSIDQNSVKFVYDKEGSYTFSVIASDGLLDSVPATITVNASKVTNTAPVINDINPVSIILGDEATIHVTSTDPENNPVQYRITPLPLPKGLKFDATSGALFFRPEEDSIGQNTFTITASDGILTSSKNISINVVAPPAGTPTSMSGRVMDTSSHTQGLEVPVIGATIRIVGTSSIATTDSNGYFTLTNIPMTQAVLKIDASTAQDAPDGSKYADFGEGITFIEGTNNIHHRPFYIPRIDASSITPYDPNNDTTVTNPNLNISAQINQGTTITNPDGSPFSGSISISEVPLAVAPVALPENLQPAQLITIQPAGIRFDPPVPVTFPNLDNLPPGTQADIWSVNIDTGMFEIVGKGEVSSDGTKIITIEGGIRAATWHAITPPTVDTDTQPLDDTEDNDPKFNPDGTPKNGASCGNSSTIAVASEINLNKGNLLETHELTSYRSMNESRSLTFVYNSKTAHVHPVSPFKLKIPLLSAVPGTVDNKINLEGLDLGVEFSNRTAFLDEGLDQLFVQNFQVDASMFETGMYHISIKSVSNYEITKVGVDFGKTLKVVNHINSPFGRGWGIQELERLYVQDNGNLFWVNGAGSYKFYISNINEPNSFISPAGEFSTFTKEDNYFLNTSTTGVKTYFHLDGKKAKVVDLNGNVTSFVYTGELLTEVIDPVGKKTILNYSSGKLTSIIDPSGKETLFEINGNNLIQITDPDTTIRNFNYDERGLLVSQIDKEGNQNSYTFNEFGFVDGTIKANQAFIESRPGAQEMMRSSSMGVRGLHGIKMEELDIILEGEEVSEYRDSNNSLTLVKYSDLDKELERTNPEGGQTIFSRNSAGLPIQITYPDGVTEGRAYDLRGNLTRTWKVLNNTVYEEIKFSYDENSRVVSVIDTKNQLTLIDRDEKGNIKSITSPNGEVTQYLYNNKGQIIKEINPKGNISEYFYDLISGNLRKVVDELGYSVSFNFDAAGNIISSVDQNGNETVMEYDSQNRLVRSEDARGGETEFSYNKEGYLKSLRDARLNSTTFTIDSEGRVTGIQDANGINETLNYDTEGNLVTQVTKNGDSITFSYNKNNELLEKSHKDDTYTFEYNPAGKLIKAYNSVAEFTYIYYPETGRLRHAYQKDIFSEETYAIDYYYTPTGKIQNFVDSDNRNTNHNYNSNDDLTDIANHIIGDNTFHTASMTYDEQRRRVRITRGSGISSSFEYDESSRLLGIEHSHIDGVISKIDYDFDKAGNITSRVFENALPITKNQSFSYDESNQLLSSTNPFSGEVETYDWDILGNRVKKVGCDFDSTFDNQNRITEDKNYSYQYDLEGNMTLIQNKTTGEVTKMEWNVENELKKITTHLSLTSDPIKTVKYFYGPLGRRIAKKINGVLTERYLYNGSQIHKVERGSDQIHYVYSDRIDEALYMVKNNVGYSLHHDIIGSVIAVMDKDRNKVEEYAYSDFGEMKAYNSNQVEINLETQGIGNIFGYTGRDIDTESEFYFYRARFYFPYLGQFLNPDPLRFKGGDTNLYRYVFNNPVSYVDPSGKFAIVASVAAISALDVALGIGLVASVGLLTDEIINTINSSSSNDKGPKNNFGINQSDLENGAGGNNAPKYNGPSPGGDLLAKIGIGLAGIEIINQCSREDKK